MEDKEKYITSHIKNHREEIDMDSLWANVSPHIPQQKKKRRIGFWIFGVMAIVALLVSFSWMSHHIEAENFLMEQSSTIGMDKPSSQTPKLQSTKETTIDAKRSIGKQENKETISTQSLKQSTDVLTTAKQRASETQQDVRGVESSKKALSKTSKIDHVQTENGTHGNIVTIDSQTSPKKILSYQDDQSEAYITSLDKLRQAILTPAILNTKSSLLDFERDIRIDRAIQVETKKEQQSRFDNRWNVYALFGGGYANRSLTNNGSAELRAERDRRESIVDVLGVWDMEVGFGFRLSPRLRIETGLMYSQVHERASFNTDYQNDVQIQSNTVIYRQDGTIFNELSTTTEQESIRTTETRYNQWRTLQIPIRVSYQVMDLNKFRLGVGGLLSYGIWQEYRGFTSFSETQESYDLKEDQEERFRNQGAMSYGVSILAARHLTSMLDLNFGLSYRHQRNINSEIYLIDQQYNFFTFNCGISRRF